MSQRLSNHLKRLRQSIPQLKVEIAQTVVAVEAEKFHNDNFRNKAWERNKWKARKDGDTSRSLLVKTGRLRRAATNSRNRGSITEFVMPIYGKVHNEGQRAGRGTGFKMPKRQFAGQSRVLKMRIKKKALRVIKQRLNKG